MTGILSRITLQSSGRLLLAVGGAIAVAVSFGLAIWLVARPEAGINMLNAYSLVTTAAAGVLAIVGGKKLGWSVLAVVLLFAGLLPVVSWIALLYWPSGLLLIAGICLNLLFLYKTSSEV